MSSGVLHRHTRGGRAGHLGLSPAQRRFMDTGTWLFAAQLAVLVWLSVVRYQHFDLAEDYGIYVQAMHQIAHGHLDPWSTIYGYPFWQNNFEWFIWPLGLLSRIVPAAALLLGLQDVALAATGWLAWRWWRRAPEAHAEQSEGGPIAMVGGLGVMIVALASPLLYATAGFDFHSEAIAAPLLLAITYDLFGDRRTRSWLWVPLLLATTAVGSTYLVGVALAGLVPRRCRRTALALLVVGVGWLALASIVGGVRPGVVGGYAYLAGNGHPNLASIVGGIVTHPSVALRTISGRWRQLARIAAASGGVGILWPPALLVDLVVIAPPSLNSSAVFVSPGVAFQVVPILGPMATGAGLVTLAAAAHLRRVPAAIAVVCITASAVACVAAAAVTDTAAWTQWSAVPGPAARTLARVAADLPTTAEVVAASGVSGRFSSRPFTFVLSEASVTFPVCAPDVVLVLTDAGLEGGFTPPTMIAAARHIATTQFHAVVLAAAHGVWAYRLRLPPHPTPHSSPSTPPSPPLSSPAVHPRCADPRVPGPREAEVDSGARAKPRGALVLAESQRGAGAPEMMR